MRESGFLETGNLYGTRTQHRAHQARHASPPAPAGRGGAFETPVMLRCRAQAQHPKIQRPSRVGELMSKALELRQERHAISLKMNEALEANDLPEWRKLDGIQDELRVRIEAIEKTS